jgi:putative Ca2+/H+ antiporter (TMEM165/GDT1 family)
MAFAARYKAWPVLIGISIATAFTHAISVGIGAVVGAQLPTDTIAIIAGVAFLVFAAWTLRGDRLDDDEVEAADRKNRNAIVAASMAFFLAELGDKTMLATITLATKEGVVGTWLGSTLGMVAADALAIVVGQQLGARLPERTIRIGASVLFVVFGVVLILEGV